MTTLCKSPIATFTAHCLTQTPHLVRHFIHLRAAEAEDEALARIGACVGGRKRPQPKAFPRGACRYLSVRHPWWKRDYEVHPRFRSQNLGGFTELIPQRLRERIAALRIQQPGLPHVPREMARADEIGKRRLIQMGRAKIVRLPHRLKAGYQSGRNDDV